MPDPTPPEPAGARVAIDTAGGTSGGAGRVREELDAYLRDGKHADAYAIGEGHNVEPRWLLRRERLARGHRKVIAANNVSFVVAGHEKWVLLRNANHFLTAREWAGVKHLHPASFARQIRIVRRLVSRAEVIVAPSTEMADRVVALLPKLQDRMVVRFHPFHPATVRRGEHGSLLLCPIINSPYKRLDSYLLRLQAALPAVGEARVVCTTDAATMPAQLRSDPRFEFVGALDRPTLTELYAQARAIYYPTEVESFGYPLAEARAMGLGVIAQDTSRTREIAGPALFGFDVGSADSLAGAVHGALTSVPAPDPGPFDPTAYFDWLLA